MSCRLVTDQDPDRLFEALRDHVLAIAPPGVRVTVRKLGGGHASLTPLDHPATLAASRALEATFGQKPVYIREGGSIPVCASFEQILGLPVVLLGFTPPDDHAHAPNEWMDLSNYETAIRTVVRMWDELAALDPQRVRSARESAVGPLGPVPLALGGALDSEAGATMHPTSITREDVRA